LKVSEILAKLQIANKEDPFLGVDFKVSLYFINHSQEKLKIASLSLKFLTILRQKNGLLNLQWTL